MGDKIPWKMILKDFKDRHPHLAKRIVYWCPHSFLTILLHIEGGEVMTYDYMKHKATILDGTWLHTPESSL